MLKNNIYPLIRATPQGPVKGIMTNASDRLVVVVVVGCMSVCVCVCVLQIG